MALFRFTHAIAESLDPPWRRIGHGRQKRRAALESWIKGAFFDCQMSTASPRPAYSRTAFRAAFPGTSHGR
jgi:hypothetical protein|tara:strand:- start:61 stop:273 length:213 start_codon:yes stop_codon:yes gene_type:complete